MKSETLFKIGSYLLIITALAHLLSFISDSPPTNETEEQILELVNNYHYQTPGGLERSVKDILIGFSICYTLFLLFAGFLNLRLVRSGIPSTLLRIVYWWNLLIWGLVLITTCLFMILPPMILHAVAWICFLLAVLGKSED